jgi:hypothetical protein
VQFQVDGSPVGSPASLASGSVTSSPIASLSVGAHTITALYSGESRFSASDNTASPLTQTINGVPTRTTLTSSTNPTVFGQSVTFTASVGVLPPSVGTPTGTVTFLDGGTALGTRTLSGTNASFSISSLSVAGHLVTALYNGDGNSAASTSAVVTQTVNKAGSSVAISSSALPSVCGESVTFTATVSATAPGGGTPSGTVTFKDGAAVLGTGTLSSGQATYTTSSLSVTNHSITAIYGGDASFKTNTSTALNQSVNKASSTVGLASSANPSVFGQSVSFTATVSAVAPASGTPTGTVQFKTNGVNFGSLVSLAGGSATSLTLSNSRAGVLSVTASYNGNTNFNTSASGTLTQTINPADTSTILASSTNASVFGQAVSFTATVGTVLPGAGTPLGTVQFQIDGASFGAPVTLAAGSATSGSTTSLSVGSHSVGAVFSPTSTNFNSSTAPAFTQVVNALTSPALVAAPITSVTQRISSGPDGTLRVTFQATPGATYVLQRAPALSGPWADAVTNTVPANGLFEFLQSNPPKPAGYYRVRLP